MSALDAVLATGKDETLVRTVLGRMRLRKESALKKVADLSWGERAKVLLARLILGDHDLLILDEPTNYLDIETQDVLLRGSGRFSRRHHLCLPRSAFSRDVGDEDPGVEGNPGVEPDRDLAPQPRKETPATSLKDQRPERRPAADQTGTPTV